MSTTQPESDQGVTVECLDTDPVRVTHHANMREAGHWAEWGHLCTANHRFTKGTAKPPSRPATVHDGRGA